MQTYSRRQPDDRRSVGGF